MVPLAATDCLLSKTASIASQPAKPEPTTLLAQQQAYAGNEDLDVIELALQ